jgi:hypothetical protein
MCAPGPLHPVKLQGDSATSGHFVNLLATASTSYWLVKISHCLNKNFWGFASWAVVIFTIGCVERHKTPPPPNCFRYENNQTTTTTPTKLGIIRHLKNTVVAAYLRFRQLLPPVSQFGRHDADDVAPLSTLLYFCDFSIYRPQLFPVGAEQHADTNGYDKCDGNEIVTHLSLCSRQEFFERLSPLFQGDCAKFGAILFVFVLTA